MAAGFYDFHERLNFSNGCDVPAGVLRSLLGLVPAARAISRAGEQQDRNGTDYWIHRHHGLPPVSVDMKNRSTCPISLYGSDDLCIETCSVYRGPPTRPWRDHYRCSPGWTIDERKRTDVICYTWPHEPAPFGAERRRFYCLYFPFLCRAALDNWREWAARYGERATNNRGYLTLSVYVPTRVVESAVRTLTVNSTTLGGRL